MWYIAKYITYSYLSLLWSNLQSVVYYSHKSTHTHTHSLCYFGQKSIDLKFFFFYLFSGESQNLKNTNTNMEEIYTFHTDRVVIVFTPARLLDSYHVVVFVCFLLLFDVCEKLQVGCSVSCYVFFFLFEGRTYSYGI